MHRSAANDCQYRSPADFVKAHVVSKLSPSSPVLNRKLVIGILGAGLHARTTSIITLASVGSSEKAGSVLEQSSSRVSRYRVEYCQVRLLLFYLLDLKGNGNL